MKDFFKEFTSNKNALIGGSLLMMATLVAIFSSALAPYSSVESFSFLRIGPFWTDQSAVADGYKFLLGTDDLGRDLLSRLIHGSKVSMGIGFLSVAFSVLFGVSLGLIAGSLGGWIDAVLSRLMDIMLALPSILLAIVVVSILGPSLVNTVIAVGIVSLPSMFRLVRATVLQEKNKNYVVAVKHLGGNWFRVYVLNVLPNCMAPILVQATFGFSDGILNAAALGFLGLGAQPPIPEWGTMLSDARSYIESAPWLVALPGLCILVVVISINLLGDGLRDIFDPKLKKQ